MLHNKNIALALEENAKRRGNHPAIINGAKVISYRDLDIAVKKIAGHLKDQNVEEGALIGVCLPDTKDHLMILWQYHVLQRRRQTLDKSLLPWCDQQLLLDNLLILPLQRHD